MGFKVTATKGGDFEKTPIPDAGNHPAVLVGIIDLGTQEHNYKGEVNDSHDILLVWELPTEKVEGMRDQTHIVWREYSFTFSPKSNLRIMLEGWRGKQFNDGEGLDLDTLLGKKCMVNVIHGTSAKGNAFPKVDKITPIPKGLAVPEPQRKPIAWTLEMPLDKLPDWNIWFYGTELREKIEGCQELSGRPAATDVSPFGTVAAIDNALMRARTEPDDQVPF